MSRYGHYAIALALIGLGYYAMVAAVSFNNVVPLQQPGYLKPTWLIILILFFIVLEWFDSFWQRKREEY